MIRDLHSNELRLGSKNYDPEIAPSRFRTHMYWGIGGKLTAGIIWSEVLVDLKKTGENNYAGRYLES